jgi:Amt family ammonium transporter
MQEHFKKQQEKHKPQPHIVGVGVLLLWIGWLFFNSGSTLNVNAEEKCGDDEHCKYTLGQESAQRAFVNTILGPAAGGLVALVSRNWIVRDEGRIPFSFMNNDSYDEIAMMNGVLCGLVGVTANCAFIQYWAAIAIGGSASIMYALSVKFLNYLQIDDPVEAFSVHGPTGAWGIFCTGLFHIDYGAFYGWEHGKQIGI